MNTTAPKVLIMFWMTATAAVSYGALMVRPAAFGLILQQAFINILTWAAGTRRSEVSILSAIMTVPAAYFAMSNGCEVWRLMMIESSAVISIILSYHIEKIMEN